MERHHCKPKETKKPKDAKCLICGTTEKLINAHIVPDKIIRIEPALSKRRFRDYDGTNIFYLCLPHHNAYDNEYLSQEHFEILKPHALRVINELNSHIIELLAARVPLSKSFFIRYQAFITSIHTYGQQEE